jgi:hypothetical protein
MTVSRQRGKIYFECDGKPGCAEVFDTEHEDFDDAMTDFRESDWEIRKIGSSWMHFCPAHGEDLEWTRK